MKKSDKIIYYVVTGLFTTQMLFAIFMYLFNTEMVEEMFTSLGVSAKGNLSTCSS